MKFEYKITNLPVKTNGYNLTAYTEGGLRLFAGTSKILDVSGILLVELAIVIHKWLKGLVSGPVDFYYASMDFEEEPIIAFYYDTDIDRFRFDSVWSNAIVSPFSPRDVVSAARIYLSQLKDDLNRECGIDLHTKLEEAIASD